jgi:transposase-like protein
VSNQRKVVRYSEAFKRQVVSDIADGTFRSVDEARVRYGIRGMETVRRWIKRYGREDLLPKVVRVEKPGEKDELKAMARRIRDLESALAETRMRELLAEGHFDALCRQQGLDPEAEKKKLLGTLSSSREARGRGKGG